MAVKKEKQNIEIEVITEIQCNRCGRISPTDPTEDGYIQMHTFLIQGEYGSEQLDDQVSYTWDLCESCIVDTTENFIIKPDKIDFDNIKFEI